MPNSFLQILTQRLNREQQESQFARSLAEQALARQQQDQLTREGRRMQQTQFDTTFNQQEKEYDQAQKVAAFNAITSGAAVPAAQDIQQRGEVETMLGLPRKGLDIIASPGTYMDIGGVPLAATTPQSRAVLSNKEALKKEAAELEIKSAFDTKRRYELLKTFDDYDTAFGGVFDPQTKKKMALKILVPGLPAEDMSTDMKEIAARSLLDAFNSPTPELKDKALKMHKAALEGLRYINPPVSIYGSPAFQLEASSHRLSGEVMPRARDLTTQVKSQLGDSNTLSDAQIQTIIAQKLLENRIARKEIDPAAASKAMENIRSILGAPPIKLEDDPYSSSSSSDAIKKLNSILSTIKD